MLAARDGHLLASGFELLHALDENQGPCLETQE